MLDLVLKGLWETIYMTVGATVLAYIVGLPLGLVLAATAADGVRAGGSLTLYHGAEGENETAIRPSIEGGEEVDFSGNKLSVSDNADGSIDNKTGLLMAADDDKKDHAYHIRFRLPEQSSVTESYARAKVYLDIGIIAEQI